MGVYLNPGSGRFEESIASEIYVDKTKLIEYTNKILGTEQKYLCVSRPRRFGKSMTANMLAAYYGKKNITRELFQGLQIEKSSSFEKNLNKYHVIFLNMQDFLSKADNIWQMRELIEKAILRELFREYPKVDYPDKEDLVGVWQEIYAEYADSFVVIIDEWDCIFREKRDDKLAQKYYLDFLRNMLKDKTYIKLAYMTGILPIKKYGSHSALNMFDEYSMIEPDALAEYIGFTEQEVKVLCARYDMDFGEVKKWYDGYLFRDNLHIYSPKSVVSAMRSGRFGTYWNKTETFEALRDYINMNFNGLKDSVVGLLAGVRKKIDIGTFANDMTSLETADDVLTLLIHLGYLGYDPVLEEVYIPNTEVATEFVNAVKSAGWDEVVRAVKNSEELLEATWRGDEEAVADGIEVVHMETSILSYNDENALSCILMLAYYSARNYYTSVRELPAGKGFADIVYLPRKSSMDKPAMLVELKWDKSAESAIAQIKEKRYIKALDGYNGKLLLIGINYDKNSKKHQCVIEKVLT